MIFNISYFKKKHSIEGEIQENELLSAFNKWKIENLQDQMVSLLNFLKKILEWH